MNKHRESCLLRRLRRAKRHASEPQAPALNRKQRRALASAQLARSEDASGKAQAKPGKVMRDGTLLLRVKGVSAPAVDGVEGWADLDGHPVRVRGQGG